MLDLQDSLGPVGSMELTLVERIAVAIWRQRRLVTAESAAIDLARTAPKIATGVSSELKRGFNPIKEEELTPFDPDRIAWCEAVVAEVDKLEQLDLPTIRSLAPTVLEQLQSDAKDDVESVDAYLAAHKGGLAGYIDQLLTWSQEQLREAAKRPRLIRYLSKCGHSV
jgi:hypothetical protein